MWSNFKQGTEGRATTKLHPLKGRGINYTPTNPETYLSYIIAHAYVVDENVGKEIRVGYVACPLFQTLSLNPLKVAFNITQI